jgi:hypothetical protein
VRSPFACLQLLVSDGSRGPALSVPPHVIAGIAGLVLCLLLGQRILIRLGPSARHEERDRLLFLAASFAASAAAVEALAILLGATGGARLAFSAASWALILIAGGCFWGWRTKQH